jgi:hypothetical protein
VPLSILLHLIVLRRSPEISRVLAPLARAA